MRRLTFELPIDTADLAWNAIEHLAHRFGPNVETGIYDLPQHRIADAFVAVSDQQRTATASRKRAVVHRDGPCCTFPGCTDTWFLHAHHITHWEDGGPTELWDQTRRECVRAAVSMHRGVLAPYSLLL